VDDYFVSVGSGNFDNRSIRLNDEANLDVLDARFAASQIQLFNKDKAKSRQITLNEKGDLIFALPFQAVATAASPEL
jgi:cardiolipin synthase A/B